MQVGRWVGGWVGEGWEWADGGTGVGGGRSRWLGLGAAGGGQAGLPAARPGARLPRCRTRARPPPRRPRRPGPQMILRGLAFCHARWVVHRDIKPNNFLVTASGELKLVGVERRGVGSSLRMCVRKPACLACLGGAQAGAWAVAGRAGGVASVRARALFSRAAQAGGRTGLQRAPLGASDLRGAAAAPAELQSARGHVLVPGSAATSAPAGAATPRACRPISAWPDSTAAQTGGTPTRWVVAGRGGGG